VKEQKLHSKLKSFFIEVGTKEGYISFSGDSECLDVRFKKQHIEYKPDVIWKSNTSCHVFEFAFTEDWRAIVGEFTLAWLAGCSSFTVFRLLPVGSETVESQRGNWEKVIVPENELRFYKNIFNLLSGKFRMKVHFVPLYHSIPKKQDVISVIDGRWYLNRLKKWKMITEETCRSYNQ
jgi:hypothetical protein